MCADVCCINFYVVCIGYELCVGMLNSVGKERLDPCGTPVLNWRCVDVVFLKVA